MDNRIALSPVEWCIQHKLQECRLCNAIQSIPPSPHTDTQMDNRIALSPVEWCIQHKLQECRLCNTIQSIPPPTPRHPLNTDTQMDNRIALCHLWSDVYSTNYKIVTDVTPYKAFPPPPPPKNTDTQMDNRIALSPVEWWIQHKLQECHLCNAIPSLSEPLPNIDKTAGLPGSATRLLPSILCLNLSALTVIPAIQGILTFQSTNTLETSAISTLLKLMSLSSHQFKGYWHFSQQIH